MHVVQINALKKQREERDIDRLDRHLQKAGPVFDQLSSKIRRERIEFGR